MNFPSASMNFNQVPSSFPAITFMFLVVKRLVKTTNCFAKQYFVKGNPPALSQVEANPEPAKKTEVEAVAEGESTEKKEEATEKQDDFSTVCYPVGIWSGVELWLYHVVTLLYPVVRHETGSIWELRTEELTLLVMAQVCSTTIKLQVIQPSDKLL